MLLPRDPPEPGTRPWQSRGGRGKTLTLVRNQLRLLNKFRNWLIQRHLRSLKIFKKNLTTFRNFSLKREKIKEQPSRRGKALFFSPPFWEFLKLMGGSRAHGLPEESQISTSGLIWDGKPRYPGSVGPNRVLGSLQPQRCVSARTLGNKSFRPTLKEPRRPKTVFQCYRVNGYWVRCPGAKICKNDSFPAKGLNLEV